jgi:hypothetical protein
VIGQAALQARSANLIGVGALLLLGFLISTQSRRQISDTENSPRWPIANSVADVPLGGLPRYHAKPANRRFKSAGNITSRTAAILQSF